METIVALSPLASAWRPLSLEFLAFILKEIRACIFAGLFFVLLLASHYLPSFGLYRYDFLFLSALLAQALLYFTGIESRDEIKTICLFHFLGLLLEIFKTHPAIGSWSYPEPGYFKVLGVPLFSGFMYASVASYMMQAWRLFDLRLEHFPPHRLGLPLAAAIYLNFFTHHFLPDFRWLLALLVLIVFYRGSVSFVPWERCVKMPLILSFVLIAFFVWIAENISTYLGAWRYPNQIHTWQIVGMGKISSWALLVIISFILVADLKHIKANRVSPTPS